MKKNILVFDNFMHWTRHFATSLEVMVDHKLEDNNIYFLSCPGFLSYCTQSGMNGTPSVSDCMKCNLLKLNGLDKFKFDNNKILYLKNNYDIKIDIPDFKNIKELKSFTYMDLDIGFAILSSITFKEKKININFEKYNPLIKQMVIDFLNVYYSIMENITKYKIDILYFFNGRFFETRAALRAAQKSNIQCYSHERAGLLNTYSLIPNNYVHDISYNENEIENLYSTSKETNEEKETIAKIFYSNIVNKVEDFYTSFIKNQEKNVLPSNFDKTKCNVSIFNSSQDEYETVSEEFLIINQEETIKNLSLYFIENDKYHFYLRVHPNLTNNNSVQINNINKLKELKLKNLTVIDPDSSIDTYALLEISDKIITFGSTVGIEAAYMNKVSIVMGFSYYSKLNSCYVAENIDDIIKYVESDLKPLNREGAIKYGYWNRKRGFEYKHYIPETVFEGKFLGSYLLPEVNNSNNLKDEIERVFSNQLRLENLNSKKYNLSLFFIIRENDTLENVELTFQSIINQIYQNIEIYIISNGDNKIDAYIENKISDNKKFILINYSKNQHFLLNDSIKQINSEFVCFINSGNCFFDSSINIAMINIKENDDVLYFNNILYRDDNKTYFYNEHPYFEEIEDFMVYILFFNFLNINSFMFRKSFLEKFTFDENIDYINGYELLCKIVSSGKHLLKMDIPFYYSNINELNILYWNNKSYKNTSSYFYTIFSEKIYLPFSFVKYMSKFYGIKLEDACNSISQMLKNHFGNNNILLDKISKDIIKNNKLFNNFNLNLFLKEINYKTNEYLYTYLNDSNYEKIDIRNLSYNFIEKNLKYFDFIELEKNELDETTLNNYEILKFSLHSDDINNDISALFIDTRDELINRELLLFINSNFDIIIVNSKELKENLISMGVYYKKFFLYNDVDEISAFLKEYFSNKNIKIFDSNEYISNLKSDLDKSNIIKNYSNSEKIMNTLLLYINNDNKLLYEISLNKFNLGKLDEALDISSELLDNGFMNPELLLLMSKILNALEDFENAEFFYDKYIDLLNQKK